MVFINKHACEMTYMKGESMVAHVNAYDHYIYVLRGTIMLSNEAIVSEGVRIFFPMGQAHGWTALEDGTIVLGVYPLEAKPHG